MTSHDPPNHGISPIENFMKYATAIQIIDRKNILKI